jgi:DNA-binding NarL/FixJ family response regulator
VIEQLGSLAPASRMLILTRSEQNRVVEAIVAGASGYILKTAKPETIIAAVKATAAGESVISSEIAGKLLQRIRELDIPIASQEESTAITIRAALTPRELEIFTRLASGKSNSDIARELSLSTNTVSNHIASILAKLHLDNRIQAAVQAVRSGIS